MTLASLLTGRNPTGGAALLEVLCLALPERHSHASLLPTGEQLIKRWKPKFSIINVLLLTASRVGGQVEEGGEAGADHAAKALAAVLDTVRYGRVLYSMLMA